MRERNAFLRKAQQINAQGKGRIFLVEKRHLEWEEKPEEIRDIKGIKFWFKESDRTHTLGDPTPRSEETEYYRCVDDLARDLADQLKRMQIASSEQAVIEGDTLHDQVLLADVTDDLIDKRDEVKRYLQQQGTPVIDRYYSSDPQEFRKQLEMDLGRSKVFVQLLSQISGRRPPGAESGYPALQFETAQNFGSKILQWHTPDLSIDELEEGGQKSLLLQPTVISEPFEQFKSRIAEVALEKPQDEVPPPSESLVFLNYSTDDQVLADQVCEWVDQQGFGYLLPMTSGRPDENREALKTNVQESDAMLILYGSVAESWVRGQLLQFRKLKGGQKKGLAIFEGPPSDKPTVGMRLPGMKVLDCRKGIDWSQVKGFLNEHTLEIEHA
jgi:hypothetical protein